MKKKNVIKLIALLLTFTIVFTTIPIVAMAKQTSVDGEKPAYIVGEIESMRTETQKVFKMSDGKMQMAVYNAPVHFENEDGEWEQINNKLKSQDSDTYTTKNTAQDISLSKKYKSGKTVEITTENTSISWGFIGANKASAEIVEQKSEELEGDEKFTAIPNAVSTTVYEDIYDNIDAEYIITGGQVKENLILNKETNQNEFEIEYRYKKLTPVQKDDKTIKLQNSKGKTVYTITAPIMTDDNGAMSDDLKLEIVSDKNNKLTVNLVVDKDWLQDKERDYPVTIDPSINLYQYEVTYQTIHEGDNINKGFATTYKNSSQPEGYQKGYGMACVNLLNFKENAYITNAKLNVNIIANTGVYAYDTGVFETINYLESGVFENAYPLDHYEYNSNSQEYSFDITKTFNQHIGGENGYLTYVFRADDESDDYEIRVSSPDTTPVLTIDYIDQNGINDKLSYHTHDIGNAGTGYINDKTGFLYLQREEFSVDAEDLPVTIKMTYTGNADDQIWVPSYFQTLIRYGNDSYSYYQWIDDTNRRVYFYDTDEGDSYYIDDNDEGYKLYTSENKIITPNGDVYIFDTENYHVNRLIKQTTEDYFDSETNTYTKAIEIDYNSSDMSINTITDGDDNVYSFSYEDEGLNPVKIKCGNKEVNYSYVSNSGYYSNLVSATLNGKTSTYIYNNNNKLTEAIANNDYKITYEYVNDDTVYKFYESGFNSENNSWVKGYEMQATYYPAVSHFWETSNFDKTFEIYTFDKKGYLQTITNSKGYAINRVNDEKGNILGSTDITIPVVNLLDDSSFEDDTETSKSWNRTYSVETTSADNSAVSGFKYAKVNNGYITKTMSGLESGETYTLSAYVKSYKDGSEISNIAITGDTEFCGIGARVVSGNYSKKSTGISGTYNDWIRVYVTFEAPSSSVELQVGLFGATGELCIDAIQLEKHKTAYSYNIAKNGDFDNNNHWSYDDDHANIWGSSAQSEIGGLNSNFLRLDGVNNENIAEQEIDIRKAQLEDLSISAWVKTEGMLARRYTTDENGNQVLEENSPFGQISLIGVKDGVDTYLSEIEILNTAEQVWYLSDYWYKVSGIVDQDKITTDYDSYKLRIEYNNQQGFLYVDGVEVMSGVMNITETEDDTTTDTETDTETEETDDYQIEDGYTIVSTINNFDTYTGNVNCNYLVNGTVVNTTNEDGETVKDETASTAYLGNSWGVTQSKDKYEYTDSTGATKTTGGIWIGNKLDKTTQSGIRFWYKSTALCSVQLRSATYGKGGTYDYIKTLPAAPKGAWVTLLYKDIETTKRKIADFKYLFVKASTAPVYVDEVQTVLQDTIIYDDIEYNVSEITQQENYGYPVIDEYIYDSTINNFNSYTGEFGYLVNGSTTNSTAYAGNSWGVTKNIDKYEYVDENTNETHLSYGITVGSFDDSKDGIRFWYKSSKECQVILREQFYGILETDYKVTLPAAPNGDWYTILFDDVANANKDLSDYYCIFIKTGSSPSVYIDELHYVVLDEEYYSVTESYETSRDGQVMKTESASKSLTLNNKLCTINKETNSLGVNTFTTTEDETGNQISAIDGNGNTINYSYDDLNNLVKMSQEIDETNLEVEYTYDSKGNISTIINGNVTYTYKYTPFGDLESISVGNTSLLTYTYESNQNRVVTKITYANKQSIEQVYDDIGLVTLVDEKDANGITTNLISYIYSETGELLKTIDGNDSYSVTLTYLDEVQVWNSDETELLYSTFQNEDKAVDYIDNNRYTTLYSSTSEETLEQNNVSESVSTITYGDITVSVYTDAFGRTIKEQTKSGDTVVLLKEYEYTANGDYTTEQIKSVTTTVGSSAPETIRYTYDNNGNITGIYSKVGNNAETTVATYEYDELNQLVKENDKNYVYDNYGNIISAGDNSYSYSTGEWKDQLTSFNGESITYDKGGNPLSYMGATLTWQKGRQLKSYSKDNLSITYKYNTDGLRTAKNVNGTVYNYVWRDSKLVHQSGGSKNIHFYYDVDDSIVGFEYNGDKYTYIKNIQGDIVGILDEAGNTVATYTYDAWGNILTATGTLAEINPIRYRGYYYDDEINLYYLQSRYYDPAVGRFINADDVIITMFLLPNLIQYNLFTYCYNNVVNQHDQEGYFAITLSTLIFVGFISGIIVGTGYGLAKGYSMGKRGINLLGYAATYGLIYGAVGAAVGGIVYGSAIAISYFSIQLAGKALFSQPVNDGKHLIQLVTKYYEKTKTKIGVYKLKMLIELCRFFNVDIEAKMNDLVNVTNHKKWDGIPHIHIGDSRKHVALTKAAVEYFRKLFGL